MRREALRRREPKRKKAGAHFGSRKRENDFGVIFQGPVLKKNLQYVFWKKNLNSEMGWGLLMSTSLLALWHTWSITNYNSPFHSSLAAFQSHILFENLYRTEISPSNTALGCWLQLLKNPGAGAVWLRLQLYSPGLNSNRMKNTPPHTRHIPPQSSYLNIRGQLGKKLFEPGWNTRGVEIESCRQHGISGNFLNNLESGDVHFVGFIMKFL